MVKGIQIHEVFLQHLCPEPQCRAYDRLPQAGSEPGFINNDSIALRATAWAKPKV